jgi:hypothetical protein
MSAVTFSRKHAVLVSIGLAFLLGDRASAQTGPLKGDLYVMAGGVNHPPYMKDAKPLRSADKDALTHAEFWPSQQDKLFGNVVVFPALTNEHATRPALLTNLARLREVAKPNDTVVVALAGHGGVVRPGQWAFCAYDARVYTSDLRPFIEDMARRGVRVLLILDTCESGGIGIQGDNIIVLAACHAKETAVDGVDNGFFTKALFEGLTGAADANRDGVITLAELIAYVAQRMEQLNNKQCPTASCPANLRCNLPVAVVVGSAPGLGSLTGSHR